MNQRINHSTDSWEGTTSFFYLLKNIPSFFLFLMVESFPLLILLVVFAFIALVIMNLPTPWNLIITGAMLYMALKL